MAYDSIQSSFMMSNVPRENLRRNIEVNLRRKAQAKPSRHTFQSSNERERILFTEEERDKSYDGLETGQFETSCFATVTANGGRKRTLVMNKEPMLISGEQKSLKGGLSVSSGSASGSRRSLSQRRSLS